jgi:hypothetical protein
LSAQTVIGNNREGSQPFRGFMREMRFWNTTRSENELKYYRYQSITLKSEISSNLVAYLMLNQQMGN